MLRYIVCPLIIDGQFHGTGNKDISYCCWSQQNIFLPNIFSWLRSHFYQLISQNSHDFINFEEPLTLSPQICSVILLMILPGLLEHLVNAAIFECILLMIRAGRAAGSRRTDRQAMLVILKQSCTFICCALSPEIFLRSVSFALSLGRRMTDFRCTTSGSKNRNV